MNADMNSKEAAPLKGLILAGGHSSRMGLDKSQIRYHGKPQYAYLLELLMPHTLQVCISCRPEQTFDLDIIRIEDAYTDIGPMAGVLSAFRYDPDCAWLVIACDLPFVNEEAVALLISKRDPTKEASFFIESQHFLPEPFLTIYEPSILPSLQHAHANGQWSINQVLQHCHANTVLSNDPRLLWSANTPEDVQQIKTLLGR